MPSVALQSLSIHRFDPATLLVLLSWLTALSVLAAGTLLILFLRMRAARRSAESAHTASGQGSILVDRNGRILETNGPARSLLWPEVRRSDALVLQDPIRGLLAADGEQHHLLRLDNGRAIQISISATQASSRLSGVRGIAVRDVTEQRRGERHLVQLAHYDSLTGLGNRRLFLERLEAAISRARDAGEQVALLYLDLDRFKNVNDTLGHAAGDELLKTLSSRFRNFLADLPTPTDRREASVSRLAGDEFAIILPNVLSVADLEALAQSVLAIITEPMPIADRTLASSGSVGIALFPDHAGDVEGLVKHADSALYVAKNLGRARFVFYEPSFSVEADRSLQIEQELRKALDRGEFSLHYQPKVDVATDTVAGFEALIRWYSRELGFVRPQTFIPIAEDRGMIHEIGAWCLDEACRQICVWQEAGFRTIPVSVNVSSVQFRDSEMERIVSDALVRYNVHPSLLEIELTESLLLDDNERTALALRELRAIGIRVALDDFGTGYSALTYLNRFPLDVIKMDRGFLRDIENSPAAAGIAEAVISMSHSLGFEVVAEGVDSLAQAELLRSMHCDQIQGFLYSPAIPCEEATRYLASVGSAAPKISPKVGPFERPSILGEQDPEFVGRAADSAAVDALDAARMKQAGRSSPPRGLVIDSAPSRLGMTAVRMMQLGADTHLVSGLDEADLFVSQDEPDLDIVIVAPQVEIARLSELMEKIRKNAVDHVPRLLVIGAEPDLEGREAIRRVGADWVLWEPFADPELRFFISAARSNRDWKFQRQRVRVPVEATAWIRSNGERRTGVLTGISRRGGFIETKDPYPMGQPIRLEFKLESQTVSIFANVTHITHASDRSAQAGINVIFYEVDAATDAAISEAVEQLWLRYRP